LFEQLTKRETEILKWIAKGLTNEAISKKLFISEETVETHRKNIKRKLNCKTTIDCSRFAAAFDLI
jgi:DNA-binding CsgD family transcriptional regulator